MTLIRGTQGKHWFVIAVAAVAIGGCASKEYLHAPALAGPDVTVTPLDIWIGGKKLWVRVNVQNNSKADIVVNRDAMTAHLPTGQTVTRAIGTYTQHEPYVIAPGTLHPVFVEFEQQGFDWHDVATAQIDFSGAISHDGQPVPVPMLPVGH